ncbi:MAG: HD domain-containing protein [Desulfurococcales archaeon]|nr:HD domain-containing protein [Desulfurococcales archaeon]
MAAAGERIALYKYKAVFLDSVHRFIPVNEVEYAILQTPFFRRLHEVRQLGYVYLVFPSAKHSRFEHTLGVMHVASRIAERVLASGGLGYLVNKKPGPEAFVELARVAGLIHDIGHPPYSHTLERPLENAVRNPEDFSLDPSKVPRVDWGRVGKYHEFVGSRFSLALARRLSREPPRGVNGEEAAGLVEAAAAAVFGVDLTGRARQTLDDLGLEEAAVGVVGQIISHRFADADRVDYLIRDAHNTGVVFGFIDLERLIHDIRLERSGDGFSVVYGPKSIPAIEDLYDARFKMYRSVYLHHKVVGLSVALRQVVSLLFGSWREVLPQHLLACVGRPEDFLNPDVLAGRIGSGCMYWDDSEFNLMVRGLARLGGQRARWARALGDSRDLLPISLIKRPDRIVARVVERVGVERAGCAIEQAMDRLGKERIVEELFRVIAGVEGVHQDSLTERIGGSSLPTLPGGLYSFYLESTLRTASMPLPYVYAYSHEEREHREAYRYAERIRGEVAEWIARHAERAASAC